MFAPQNQNYVRPDWHAQGRGARLLGYTLGGRVNLFLHKFPQPLRAFHRAPTDHP